MSIRNKVCDFLRKAINFVDSDYLTSAIIYNPTFRNKSAEYMVWYNGDASQLRQFYQSYSVNFADIGSFWASDTTRGNNIRRVHTGLPKLIVNSLCNITLSDMEDIQIDDNKTSELWSEIESQNKFKQKLTRAVKNTLIVGDGAFKIGFNPELGEMPNIEWYNGNDVDFVYRSGKLHEIKFYDYYMVRDLKYTLEETYGFGYIKYKLFRDETEVPLGFIPETDGLQDVEFDNRVMLAVQFKIWESEAYQGRGQSVFDGKIDSFDAMDETASQWIDAVRSGRVKTYIPENLIPRDQDGNLTMKPNPFDNRFIRIESNMAQDGKNEIKTIQPDINVESLNTTYIQFLGQVLQGVISPSTLGIDVKKMDNAESQREKEKTTLYTRQAIVDALAAVVKELVSVTLNAYQIQFGQTLVETECSVDFGEYANPSFEATIETMSNPNTPMSIQAKVDEIWGDTKDEGWKAEEVARIKSEMGIILADEPALNSPMDDEPNELADSGDDTEQNKTTEA